MYRLSLSKSLICGLGLQLMLGAAGTALAQDRTFTPYDDRRDPERIQPYGTSAEPQYQQSPSAPPRSYAGRGGDDAYRPVQREPGYGATDTYASQSSRRDPIPYRGESAPYEPGPAFRDQGPPPSAPAYGGPAYGAPYSAPQPGYDAPQYERREVYQAPPRRDHRHDHQDGTFSAREITEAGHGFFGSISQGLASVVEYAFRKQGRPNGYILGEDIGGAFVAGLRYGEGRLHTKDAGSHKVYWQGPSVGFDAGGEGSKVMVLVYNLRDPSEIYKRFGGVAGSAYVVGGVGLNFQSHDHIVLAPIRAGVGLRLGANIGYLKYSRRPTWNPF